MALCVLTYNLTRILNIVGVPALLEAKWDRCGHPPGHADGDGPEATQVPPKARSGCPFDNFFSNWASGARLGASAGVHIPGFDISTQPRPRSDISVAERRHLTAWGDRLGRWLYATKSPALRAGLKSGLRTLVAEQRQHITGD